MQTQSDFDRIIGCDDVCDHKYRMVFEEALGPRMIGPIAWIGNLRFLHWEKPLVSH